MLSTKDFQERQIVFVRLQDHEKICFRNDNILIKDKDDTIKFQTTCYLLFALYIVGTLTITSPILQQAQRFGFSIILMNQNFRVYGYFFAKAEGNTLLRRMQYTYQGNEVGAWIIANKIKNQRETLNLFRKKNTELKTAIETLDLYSDAVKEPDLTIPEIMGIEGMSSKLYFKHLFAGTGWTARRPRVKQDPTNCLLDIGYTMLFNLIEGLLQMYGFDTYVGVLHREFFHRKSLACDIVEPFRPVIDRAIMKAIHLGQVDESDFYLTQRQYSLFGKKATPYLQMLSHALMDKKNEMFLYVQQYYRAFIRGKDINEFPIFTIKEEKY